MADRMNTIPALCAADLNTKLGDDPRIADLRLAGLLGFGDLHKIRPLIDRHRSALECFGAISATVAGNKGCRGRPGKTYWLNKRQALFICTKSDAPLATEVTIRMVEVFDEYLTDQLRPVKVKAHRRSLPTRDEPGRQPHKFDPASDILRDLIAAVHSANRRTGRDVDFGEALQQTLEDIQFRRERPDYQPRGDMLDWNALRGSQALYDRLRAQGRDDVKFPNWPVTH